MKKKYRFVLKIEGDTVYIGTFKKCMNIASCYPDKDWTIAIEMWHDLTEDWITEVFTRHTAIPREYMKRG